MSQSKHLEVYREQFERLNNMVLHAEKKLLDPDSIVFLEGDANFLSKSFLIMMCAYLESYIKDVCMLMVEEYNSRLIKIAIPHNIVKWVLSKKEKDSLPDLQEKDLRFENLLIQIKKKELDGFISGNPYRTESLLKKFGLQPRAVPEFMEKMEQVNSIVEKRNSIVHHNDTASDLTLSDLSENSKLLMDYIEVIDKMILNHLGEQVE